MGSNNSKQDLEKEHTKQISQIHESNIKNQEAAEKSLYSRINTERQAHDEEKKKIADQAKREQEALAGQLDSLRKEQKERIERLNQRLYEEIERLQEEEQKLRAKLEVEEEKDKYEKQLEHVTRAIRVTQENRITMVGNVQKLHVDLIEKVQTHQNKRMWSNFATFAMLLILVSAIWHFLYKERDYIQGAAAIVIVFASWMLMNQYMRKQDEDTLQVYRDSNEQMNSTLQMQDHTPAVMSSFQGSQKAIK